MQSLQIYSSPDFCFVRVAPPLMLTRLCLLCSIPPGGLWEETREKFFKQHKQPFVRNVRFQLSTCFIFSLLCVFLIALWCSNSCFDALQVIKSIVTNDYDTLVQTSVQRTQNRPLPRFLTSFVRFVVRICATGAKRSRS